MNELNRRTFLSRMAHIGLTGAGLSALSVLNQSCGDFDISQTARYIKSASKIFTAGSKALEDITPENEYYIGRTIGAIVLSKDKRYQNKQANAYLNLLGQTLARFSDLPMLYDGYHFLILDSKEINAFATPSGLIFVTRGMLRCCTHEGALAAVLAHEVGHIQHRHGMQSIEKGRIIQAVSILALEATKTLADSDIASLTETFEGSIDDIVTTMINNGYSRSFEREADESAVTILKRTGYDPRGIIDMLKMMDRKLKPGGLDFAATHPSPGSRIEDLTEIIGSSASSSKEPAARTSRFKIAMQGV